MRWTIALVLAGCGFSGATNDGVVPDASPEGDARLDDAAPIDGTSSADAPDGPVDGSAPSVGQLCMDAGYTLHGLSYYRVVGAGATWDAAEVDCEDDVAVTAGALASTHLVVFKSQPEVGVVASLSTSDVWVGYSDRRNEASFLWVTDEPGTFSPPINGNADAKDCGLLRMGGFHARDCTDLESYVCECDTFAVNRDNY